MLLRLIELNFNDSILGRIIMHSLHSGKNAFSAFCKECIQNAFSAKNKNQEPRFPPGLLNKS